LQRYYNLLVQKEEIAIMNRDMVKYWGKDNSEVRWTADSAECDIYKLHRRAVLASLNTPDVIKEAEEEASKYEYSSIEEYPSEEWWTVVGNESGKAVFNRLFPTPEMALACLYKEIQPEAWMKYCEACDNRKGIDISDHLVRMVDINKQEDNVNA
jgi:hypothetical protein